MKRKWFGCARRATSFLSSVRGIRRWKKTEAERCSKYRTTEPTIRELRLRIQPPKRRWRRALPEFVSHIVLVCARTFPLRLSLDGLCEGWSDARTATDVTDECDFWCTADRMLGQKEIWVEYVAWQGVCWYEKKSMRNVIKIAWIPSKVWMDENDSVNLNEKY